MAIGAGTGAQGRRGGLQLWPGAGYCAPPHAHCWAGEPGSTMESLARVEMTASTLRASLASNAAPTASAPKGGRRKGG